MTQKRPRQAGSDSPAVPPRTVQQQLMAVKIVLMLVGLALAAFFAVAVLGIPLR
jgi:hypothetical protein